MKVVPTALPGVLLLIPRIFRDDRGAFWETWNQRLCAEAGMPLEWVQDNCSSSAKNVIRGLHYQIIQPQGKLVRATRGAILDVAVDLRRSSPDFGRHVTVELTSENGHMLYVPVGFAHGFAALTEDVGVAYKVTDYYCSAGERTVAWNDPDIAISWPVAAGDALLSDKDRNGSLLREAEVFA
jgi:dTDP-4-dehydrorhamnose 3,5-epimerase